MGSDNNMYGGGATFWEFGIVGEVEGDEVDKSNF